MNRTAEALIKQHLAYATEHPEELKKFDTIFDHMVFYFHSVLGMSALEARRVLYNFGDPSLRSNNTYRFRTPLSYVRQPANSMHFAVYAVAVQALLT